MDLSKNTITLSEGKNKKKEYDILLTFESEDSEKFYIVYTDNELDEDGFIKTYAGIYNKTSSKEELLPVESEEELSLIEKLLSKLDEGNGESSEE